MEPVFRNFYLRDGRQIILHLKCDNSRFPNDAAVTDLFESLNRAGKLLHLPHHCCTNRTLTIGEFTLRIWRDTYVAKVPWTGATTPDANAREAELYQYVTVAGDEGDANDNNEIWIETFAFDTYEKAVELAQLAAAIGSADDLLGVQFIPPDLHAACTRLMELPKNIALHQTETNTKC